MISNKLTRTTIRIPEDLLFEIKKEALMEKKTITDLISEGLHLYLKFKSDLTKFREGKTGDITGLFGAWGKGASGLSTVKTLRKEKTRDIYLKNLWNKS